jgi:hypothetical protein
MTQLIIDADTHLTEPRDVWTDRVPPRNLDEVPHDDRHDARRDAWILDAPPSGWAKTTASIRAAPAARSIAAAASSVAPVVVTSSTRII